MRTHSSTLIWGWRKLELTLTDSADASTCRWPYKGLKLRAGSFIQTGVI